MVTSNGSGPKRPAKVRRRHAARVKDWRERDELRERVWKLMSGPKGDVARAEVAKAIRRIEKAAQGR